MPMKWVSRRRRPILSPPGCGTTACPKRDSNGPTSMMLPRRAPACSRNCGLCSTSRFTWSAWNSKVRPLSHADGTSSRTLTPRSFSRSISLFTSRMSGTCSMRTFSEVSSTAHSTCRASFLAPCGTISPLSLRPPMISKLLIFSSFSSFSFRRLPSWRPRLPWRRDISSSRGTGSRAAG